MEIKWLLTCACCCMAFSALLNFALVPAKLCRDPECGLVGGMAWVLGGNLLFYSCTVAVAEPPSWLSEIESKCLCCVSWANRPQTLSASNDTATPTRTLNGSGRRRRRLGSWVCACGPCYYPGVCLQFYKHVVNSFLQASQVALVCLVFKVPKALKGMSWVWDVFFCHTHGEVARVHRKEKWAACPVLKSYIEISLLNFLPVESPPECECLVAVNLQCNYSRKAAHA